MFKSLEDKQMGEHNFIIIIYYFIIFLFLKIMWMIFLDIEKKMTNQIPWITLNVTRQVTKIVNRRLNRFLFDGRIVKCTTKSCWYKLFHNVFYS